MTKNAPKYSEASGTADKYAKAGVIAARLGIHPKTLFRWADQGLVQRYKVSARVVLFREAEITAFINSARIT